MSRLLDETHDPERVSWVAGAAEHPDFPIQNLSYGIFDAGDDRRRPGVAIGDSILDLQAAAHLLPEDCRTALQGTTLNALFALPSGTRVALRRRLSTLLSSNDYRDQIAPLLFDSATCTLHLPASIGDYTDFYVGIHHAQNVGSLFRPDNPLLPNYKHIPIGYHGRASSIRPSGVPLVRPKGQRKSPDASAPIFGPCTRLDYELELGVWIGEGNALGEAIPIGEAPDHVVGLSLLNDWSARDVQAWEYQPLGPFLAKNFHTTVSPWVVTVEALAPFRMAQPTRPEGDPAPLPYLWDAEDQAAGAFSIALDVYLSSARMRDAGMPALNIAHSAASHMYWTIAQMVAHHSSNGCDLRPGDLIGTGTISAPTDDGYGSLLEITHGGAKPLTLPTGESRCFLEDGDEVTMAAHANAEGYRAIGFGACRAVVLPAR